MRKIVYTILFGDYNLVEPKYNNNNWDLICFTNKNIKSKKWNIIQKHCDDPFKESRKIKIRCDKFLDFDICLYLDSKFTVKCNLDDFVNNNLKSNMLLMRHNKRNCLYDEANYCIKLGKGNKNIILNQINNYRKDGFPKNFGLYAPGIMLRKNSPEIINFMKLWYNEVDKYTYRDQISFPYVLWKTPINFDSLPFKETYNTFRIS